MSILTFCLAAAQLSFIDVTDYNILSDIDDGCVAVELPGPLQFGCFTFSRAFVSHYNLTLISIA